MSDKPIHVKFENSQNPLAKFDLLRLEYLFKRDDIDHSPFHLHLVEFYMIIFIEDGQGAHTIDFTDYRYQKNTLLTVRKDQIHKFIKNDSARGTLLLFTDDFLVSYLEKLYALKSLQLFNEILGVPKIQLEEKEAIEISHLIKRIEKEYLKVDDDYSLGIIRSELHILIAKLFRLKSKENEIISGRKYLGEFITFQELVEKNATKYTKVKDYAKLMSVSTKTLNTITKTIVHKSAKEFIDEICTKQIKRLLINTELSIKEIAYTSGFEESTNLNHKFSHFYSLSAFYYIHSSLKCLHLCSIITK